MSEAVGNNSKEPKPDTTSELTNKASDCLATFAERLTGAEDALTQFNTTHQGRELDEPERLELSGLRSRVEHEEALIQGATIMVEHLGLPAPDGSIAWGNHNAAANQLATDVRSITT